MGVGEAVVGSAEACPGRGRRRLARAASVVGLTIAMLLAAASVSVAGAPPAAGEPGSKPVLYLTFDDGPSRDSVTMQLLDLLNRYDVEATFFVVGANVRLHPERLRAMVEGGHAIGNHTDSHDSLTLLNRSDVRRQLVGAQEAVTTAGGPEMVCYRPPYGHTSDGIRQIASEMGLVEELWDLSFHDWDRARTKEQFLDGLRSAGPGDVVLLHDGWVGQHDTLAAVEEFLAERHDEFDFRALPSCEVPWDGSGPPRPPVDPGDAVPEERVEGPTLEPGPTPWRDPAEAIDLDSSAQRVERLYQTVFARAADPEGRGYWVSVAERSSMQAVTEWFLTSPEFAAVYRVGSEDEFVRRLYRNALGRTADAGGLAFWVEALQSGAQREDVAGFFAESPELRERLPVMRMSGELRSAVLAKTTAEMPLEIAYLLWDTERRLGTTAAIETIDSLLCLDCGR